MFSQVLHVEGQWCRTKGIVPWTKTLQKLSAVSCACARRPSGHGQRVSLGLPLLSRIGAPRASSLPIGTFAQSPHAPTVGVAIYMCFCATCSYAMRRHVSTMLHTVWILSGCFASVAPAGQLRVVRARPTLARGPVDARSIHRGVFDPRSRMVPRAVLRLCVRCARMRNAQPCPLTIRRVPPRHAKSNASTNVVVARTCHVERWQPL